MSVEAFSGKESKEAAPTKERLDKLSDDFTKGVVRQSMDKLNKIAEDPTPFFRDQAEQSWARFDAFKSVAGTLDISMFQEEGSDRNPYNADTSTGTSKKDVGVKVIFARLQDALTIDSGMSADDPAINIKQRPAAAYLRTEVMTDQTIDPPERYSQIRVDTDTVVRDRDYLIKLSSLYPNNPGLQNMIAALVALCPVDPADYAANEKAIARTGSPANKALAYAGTLGAVVALTGMTALAGVMSIVNKRASVVPFVTGGMLLYLLNPNFFASKNRRELDKVAGITNSAKFTQEMAPNHGMEGDDWEQVFRNMFDMKNKSDSPLGQFDKNKITADQLAEALAPGEPNAARGNLLALIENETDFKIFRGMLAGIDTKDTQDLIAAYIRDGGWKYVTPATQYAATNNTGRFNP